MCITKTRWKNLPNAKSYDAFCSRICSSKDLSSKNLRLTLQDIYTSMLLFGRLVDKHNIVIVLDGPTGRKKE